MSLVMPEEELYNWMTSFYLRLIEEHLYTKKKYSRLMLFNRKKLYSDRQARNKLRDELGMESLSLAYQMKSLFENDDVRSATVQFKMCSTLDKPFNMMRCRRFNGKLDVRNKITVEIEQDEETGEYLVHNLLLYDGPVILRRLIDDIVKWNRCEPSNITIDSWLLVASHLYARNPILLNDLTECLFERFNVSESSISVYRGDKTIPVGIDNITFGPDIDAFIEQSGYGYDDFCKRFLKHYTLAQKLAYSYVVRANGLRGLHQDALAEEAADSLWHNKFYITLLFLEKGGQSDVSSLWNS